MQFEANNLQEDQYQNHLAEKERARGEKQTDKENALKVQCNVICMVFQAVKVCPSLNACCMYFKTKLNCHRFTIYNETAKDATCYCFDET